MYIADNDAYNISECNKILILCIFGIYVHYNSKKYSYSLENYLT